MTSSRYILCLTVARPSSTRNKNMLDKCDVYLPSTTYKDMKAFDSFEELPHRRGYGVVILKNKREIKKALRDNGLGQGQRLHQQTLH